MGKEQRLYSVVRKVDGSSSLIELLSIEETYSPARALDLAVERLAPDDRIGDYAAIAGIAWKPWGRQMIEVTGWGEAKVDAATPALHRDADGNAPLEGQTDLEDVGVPVDGEPIPEAEVAVEPIPHVIADPDPEAAKWTEEQEKATAEHDAQVAKAAADYEAQVAAEKAEADAAAQKEAEQAAAAEQAQADAAKKEAAAARKRQLAEDKARAAAEEAAEAEKAPASQQAEAAPSGDVAANLAAVQARRRAAAEAKRDEPPAPVNTPDSGFEPPSDW